MRLDPLTVDVPGDERLLAVLREAAAAVARALVGVEDRRARGGRPGQYALDLVADDVVREVLHDAGLAVFSEESGTTAPLGRVDDDLLVVVDPVDGSTNASLGIPWFATSLCVLDAAGPRVALVVNQASGVEYWAVRGGGAWRGGTRLAPSGCRRLEEAVVGVSGLPAGRPAWAQFRALGAAALDLCLVAEGTLDGYRVAGHSTLAAWDYLGGMLVCAEAGAFVGECDGAPLVVRDGSPRRPAAAATTELLGQLLAAGV